MAQFKFGKLPILRICWAVAAAVSLSWFGIANAQQSDSRLRPTTAGEKLGGQKLTRPAGDPMRVDVPPEELLTLLKKWEAESAKVRRLQGEHLRWEYDYTFNIVKRNSGVFYYEQPDKGRIDLKPTEVNGVETKKHWQSRQTVQFKVQSGAAERWYCDGQLVTQIDDQQKTATRMVIPPQNQGEHIIDGPLPFLFGMPADKALRRYRMEIIGWEKDDSDKPIKVTLQVEPKLRSDAANYQLATIILDLRTYLPAAVRMIDPAGTKETVYSFLALKVNAKAGILPAFLGGGEKDPFKPNLKDLKVVVKAPIDERAEQTDGLNGGTKVVPASGSGPAMKSPTINQPPRVAKPDSAKASPKVPSVVGLGGANAKTILEEQGYKVVGKWGALADREEQVRCVEQQEPDAKTALPQGETVTIWLFKKRPTDAVKETK